MSSRAPKGRRFDPRSVRQVQEETDRCFPLPLPSSPKSANTHSGEGLKNLKKTCPQNSRENQSAVFTHITPASGIFLCSRRFTLPSGWRLFRPKRLLQCPSGAGPCPASEGSRAAPCPPTGGARPWAPTLGGPRPHPSASSRPSAPPPQGSALTGPCPSQQRVLGSHRSHAPLPLCLSLWFSV